MTSATVAPGQPGPRLNAAFYADSVAAFLRASDDEAYAPLASPHGYTLAPEQLSAWRLQLPVLRAGLGIWPRPRDCLGRKRGTGVPGAGKTLVGLNVATRHGSRDDAAHAVFLSGNGPLVAMLREALARDDLDRAKLTDPRARIGTSRTAVRAFIQNVHHFRDATLRDRSAPADHVVVFDEAQRAWDARQLASFMKRKKGLPGFTQTEPELLIGAMERHADWAVVVCLVGGGQEINTGEAGISAWLDGVRTLFPDWDIFISPHLTDSEYAATGALARLTESRAKREAKTVPATIFTSDVSTPLDPTKMVAGTLFAGTLTTDASLHLSTSMRSFRAEHVSRFVKALLDGVADLGRDLLAAFREQYPIVLTRSMRAARRWIRQQRRGTERAGLVASSSAQRLKPHAIDLFSVDAAPAAGMQDRQPNDLFAPITHDDVVGPELAVGRLCPRFKVHVDHVRWLVIGALHRSMRSLENGRDRVEKIAQLDGGHTCLLRLKIAATREVTNAVITKPSCASTSL